MRKLSLLLKVGLLMLFPIRYKYNFTYNKNSTALEGLRLNVFD